MTIALPARAKLNLDLRVLGRMPDGFHEIVTTMQAISLHDLVIASPAATTSLTVEGIPIENPHDADNSILKAQAALERAAHRPLPARFHLHKRIPPGSGMGGASSDAAAALVALKAMYRLDVDLHRIAQTVGADVPFFLRGGRARAEGRGEKLTPLASDAPEWFAIAWPGIELSTAAVYRAWDEVKGDGPNELRRAAERVEPRIATFARTLGEGWLMTGSGSAFFKPCATEQQAQRAVAAHTCWTAVASSVGPRP